MCIRDRRHVHPLRLHRGGVTGRRRGGICLRPRDTDPAVDLAAVRTRQDHREPQGHPVPHRRFLRRECGGGTGGGGRAGGAAEKVFRRGAGDRDRHRNEGASAVRILQISKKETPMGVSFFAYLSASAAARRARRKERTTASPLTPGRRATPSSRQQGGSMARTVRSWRA